MSDAPDAIEIFRTRIADSVEDPDAKLGESLDALYGFGGEPLPDPATVLTGVAPGSWRARPASFRSELELRLQGIAEDVLRHAADTLRSPALPDADHVCVRIVDDVHGSPAVHHVGGVHYIVIPSGFLKSLENVWRIHAGTALYGSALAVAGAAVPDRAVGTNYAGGASIETAFAVAFRQTQIVLGMLMIDAGWHRWFDGPLLYPEAMIAHGARMGYELIHGFYSSDDVAIDELRPAPTSLSRLLARAVLIYAVAHEVAHAIFAHEGSVEADANPVMDEIACDLFATMFVVPFTGVAPAAWQLHFDGATEFIGGMLGFFEFVELREQLVLVLAMSNGEMKEGDAGYRQLADRLDAIAERRRAQVRMIERLHGDAERSAPVRLLAIELHGLAVGVQMLGVRLLLRRASTFGAHMRRWAEDNGLGEAQPPSRPSS